MEHEALSLEPGQKPGLFLNDIMEHVAIDIPDRLHDLPPHLRVRDPEAGLLGGLELAEFDRVGVARIEDYLDQVDALTPLNLKLKTVPDIDEGVSPEKGQGVAAQLAGNYPSNHLKTPCSPNSFPTAALRLAAVVWV